MSSLVPQPKQPEEFGWIAGGIDQRSWDLSNWRRPASPHGRAAQSGETGCRDGCFLFPGHNGDGTKAIGTELTFQAIKVKSFQFWRQRITWLGRCVWQPASVTLSRSGIFGYCLYFPKPLVICSTICTSFFFRETFSSLSIHVGTFSYKPALIRVETGLARAGAGDLQRLSSALTGAFGAAERGRRQEK